MIELQFIQPKEIYMSKYKLLFLDIDGTILRPDDTIEETTKSAIAEVQSKGIDVFLATGRPLHEIEDIIEELKVNSYIGYNGAFGIFRDQVLFNEPMHPKTVLNLLAISREYGHEAVLYKKNHNTFTSLDSSAVHDFINKFHFHKNQQSSDDKAEDVLGMTLIDVKDHDLHYYQNNEEIHLSQVNVEGMENCYDVIRCKVNKGMGVNLVLDYLGISKDEAIAFGDGMNDKEMLMSVGESFAMGNAHPDLFAFAKNKTSEVTSSGIYNGLKSLGLVD
jgi:Cof subfamily protein (haloacid dehalogenase superfamily)